MKKRNPATLSIRPAASAIAISIAAAFALAACGGGGDDPSRVSAKQAGSAENVSLNQPTPITLTFNSKDGTSKNLSVTNLGSLPTDWTVASSDFTCPTVGGSGNACQLTLTYTPSASAPASVLPITYTYTDDENKTQTRTVNIKYSTAAGGSTASIAYVTQLGATIGTGSILKCSVGSDGALSGCADSGAGATLPAPVAIDVSGSNMYVLNQGATAADTTLYKCAIGADGTLSACTNQEDNVAGADSDIRADGATDFVIAGNFGYMLKEGGQVLQCTSTGGNISECIEPTGTAVSGLSIPADFAFTGNRVYVVNTGTTAAEGSVSACSVAADTGIISDCTTASADTTLQNAPTGIAINGSNAYIVTRDNNSVVQCAVDGTSGALTDCTSAALPAATGTAQANRIAIQGGFAYITSSSATAGDNNVVKCTINPATNALEGCAAVPGITFTGEAKDIDFFAPQS